MNECVLIAFGIAMFFLMAIVAFVVLSRINDGPRIHIDIKEVDYVEPLGDMI